MIGNQAQDFIPVPRPFPQGHEKAGRPMHWLAKCPGCEQELAGLRTSKLWLELEETERAKLEAPILKTIEIVQVEADPKWLKLAPPGAVAALKRAFGENVRFPNECARHAHFTLEREYRRSQTQAEACDPALVGIGTVTFHGSHGFSEMTDEQRFGG